MKAIILTGSDNLTGKVIKGVSYMEDSHLVITFTDDTYIMIECSEYLRSVEALPLEKIVSPFVSVFPRHIQELIDLGVLVENPDKMEKAKRLWEEAEYQNYLVLKKKYEGRSM